MKNTKVRNALLQLLEKTSSPLSISEILALLASQGLKPNKTTIYRELEFLSKKGLTLSVDFGEGKKRYESSGEHHHHIICVKCKSIKDIHMDQDLEKFNAGVAKQAGFKPVGHSLEFFGLCFNCQ